MSKNTFKKHALYLPEENYKKQYVLINVFNTNTFMNDHSLHHEIFFITRL